MTDNGNLNSPVPALPQSVTVSPQPSALKNVFIGPNGLRAGWRFLIYFVLVFALSFVVRTIKHLFVPAPPPNPNGPFEPVHEIYARGMGFLISAVAALIMTRFEPSKWEYFGLPLRRALSFDFWFGMLWGFGGLSLVMGGLYLTGSYRVEGLALAGGEIAKFAILWAIMFYFVGLFEEFLLRGYTQYTLASGIGFWPAAVLLSAVFLYFHIGNSGENPLGLADVFIIGFFLCLTLWRTGDLWFAVGMHAAWDWGLTFFYSVPNSGTTAIGHLFNVKLQGPTWLSGGSAGPEGSVINIAFDLLCFGVFLMFYKRRKWVGMNDRRVELARASSTAVVLDTSSLTQGS